MVTWNSLVSASVPTTQPVPPTLWDHRATASYMDAVALVFHPMVAYFCVRYRDWHCRHNRFKPVRYTGAVTDAC